MSATSAPPDRALPTAAALASEGGSMLARMGERVRLLRARRGMTRASLASAAGISLRHLADLENGQANVSVLLLFQVARALNVALDEVVCERSPDPAQLTLLIEALRGLPEARLRLAKSRLADLLHDASSVPGRARRIALIGLRGAGKTTLGKQLATRLGVPFIELNRAIEAAAGLSVGEIHSLYGQAGYRRYERACLEAVLAEHEALVLGTPGSLVSEAQTYNVLLAHCFTVWLKTTPEQHMARVVAQGDLRPMAGQKEAMADLRRILDGRKALYAQADLTIDTSLLSEPDTLAELWAGLPTHPHAQHLPAALASDRWPTHPMHYSAPSTDACHGLPLETPYDAS